MKSIITARSVVAILAAKFTGLFGSFKEDAAHPVLLEALEGRNLASSVPTFNFTNGVLEVTGSTGSDSFQVVQRTTENGDITQVTSRNGNAVAFQTYDFVGEIKFNLEGSSKDSYDDVDASLASRISRFTKLTIVGDADGQSYAKIDAPGEVRTRNVKSVNDVTPVFNNNQKPIHEYTNNSSTGSHTYIDTNQYPIIVDAANGDNTSTSVYSSGGHVTTWAWSNVFRNNSVDIYGNNADFTTYAEGIRLTMNQSGFGDSQTVVYGDLLYSELRMGAGQDSITIVDGADLNATKITGVENIENVSYDGMKG